ncbi:MAG TPA: GDSL-type esterase/lipase family protein [Pseudolabrys sp.]|nr:GDSL-type esterase/lipase family protein [Pseudolabrys sp.]
MRTLVAFIGLLAFVCGAQAKTIHIVAFGDSATEGWLVDRKDAYPAQLQRMLRGKGYDVSVTNAGISGDTTKGALARFDEAIGPDTDIALVELGTNDLRMHVPAAIMHTNLTAIVQTLRRRGIEVLLIGLGSLNLSRVAKENGIPYAQWKLPAGKFRASDGQHFNAQGYRIVVTRMLPQVEILIQRKHR